MIKTLLRSYSGLFEEYRKINEYLLAKRLRLPVDKVKDQLIYLDKVKLLEYLPANQGPQLTWLVERLPKTHLHISYEQYGLLKGRQEKRAGQFIEYLKTDVCRNRQLLAYFGEETSEDCGKCDVCLKNAMRKKEMKTMENEMIRVLKGGPVSLQLILSSVPKLKEEWALEMLRFFADEGLIIKDDENRWKWIM
jgi:ATP-dependent DNA helicase RecQ